MKLGYIKAMLESLKYSSLCIAYYQMVSLTKTEPHQEPETAIHLSGLKMYISQ